MASIVKVFSTEVDNLKRRVVKFLRYGSSDFQTSLEAGPFGFDSNPIKDMVAIYAESGTKGKTLIVGYLNKNQVANVGEVRLYSTDENGQQKMYAWLKNDGTMELGGDSDHLVRFSKLEEGFNKLRDDFNTFAQAYTPGGPSSVGTPPTIMQSQASIADAKINEIKTF
jgi:hypothetical protein